MRITLRALRTAISEAMWMVGRQQGTEPRAHVSIEADDEDEARILGAIALKLRGQIGAAPGDLGVEKID